MNKVDYKYFWSFVAACMLCDPATAAAGRSFKHGAAF